MNVLLPQRKKSDPNRMWLVLLFLFAADALTYGSYILVLILGIYGVTHFRELTFTVTEVCLFIFGAVYFLMWTLHYGFSVSDAFNCVFAPWLIFWFGRNLIYQTSDAHLLIRLIRCVSLGFFLHLLLNIVFSAIFAPPSVGNRVVYDFWDGEYMSVTCCGLMLSMALGTAFGTLKTSLGWFKRILWLGIIFAGIYFSFTWAHRSTLVIIAILAVYHIAEILWGTTERKTRKTMVILGISFLSLGVAFCLFFDIGNSFSWLRDQWLFQRFTDEAVSNSSGRIAIWQSFFAQWLWHPFGGGTMELYKNASYAHNLWLDIYNRCGMVPFAAFLAATVCSVISIIKYCKILKNRMALQQYYIIVYFFLAVFLNFMIEPAWEANPYVVLSALLICGAVNGALQKGMD